MDEEKLDFSPFITPAMKHWRLVLGCTLAMMIMAGSIAFLTPVTYESAASVAISDYGAKPVPDAKAWLDLAYNDVVLDQVSSGIGQNSAQNPLSSADLRRMLTASPGPDPSIVYLRVRGPNPELSSRLAGLWSEAFVPQANARFAPPEYSVSEFDGQLEAARNRLKALEDALSGSEGQNRSGILEAELSSKLATLANLYSGRTPLEITFREAKALAGDIQRLNPQSSGNPSDDFAITLIQAKILSSGLPSASPPGTSLQSGSSLQVVAPTWENRPNHSVAEQLAAIERLLALTREKSDEIEAQIAAIQPSILELQQELQQARSEHSALVARRDAAREAVRQLEAGKTTAIVARASTALGVGNARLIAQPSTAVEVRNGSPLRNLGIAAVLGIIAGAAVSFGLDFVERQRSKREAPSLDIANQRGT